MSIKNSTIRLPFREIGKGVSLIAIATLLALTVTVGTSRSQIEPREQARAEFIKWQSRVDGLTKEINAESASVSDSERSLYLALLGKIWWKIDEKDARLYVKNAGDKMLSGLRSEDKAS